MKITPSRLAPTTNPYQSAKLEALESFLEHSYHQRKELAEESRRRASYLISKSMCWERAREVMREAGEGFQNGH